jgi:putative DNA primase/helicase
VTNHRPQIIGIDHAIWRRIRLLEFPVKIRDEDKDPDIDQKLRAEMSGVLNWARDGCLAWRCGLFSNCATVNASTERYRSEEDVIATFLAEEYETGPGFEVGSTEIYHAFNSFAPEARLSQKEFGLRMTHARYERKRGRDGRQRYLVLLR